MALIASLVIADPAELWVGLGFTVDRGKCWISGVSHHLGATGTGILGWSVKEVTELTELPTADERDPFESEPTPVHPNGVTALDHLVVRSGTLSRTIEALESAGINLRRTRRFDGPDGPVLQAFFKMGDVVLELVGPADTPIDEPPRFYGLAYEVRDLDATAAYLGDRLRPARDAVQTGRRIATLDKSAGSSVPIAFMSPRPGVDRRL